MDNYTLMKLAEQCDEDAYDVADMSTEDMYKDNSSSAEAFKRKYKEFYTDIKLSHKEDW